MRSFAIRVTVLVALMGRVANSVRDISGQKQQRSSMAPAASVRVYRFSDDGTVGRQDNTAATAIMRSYIGKLLLF